MMFFSEVSQVIFVTVGHKTSLSPSKASCSLSGFSQKKHSHWLLLTASFRDMVVYRMCIYVVIYTLAVRWYRWRKWRWSCVHCLKINAQHVLFSFFFFSFSKISLFFLPSLSSLKALLGLSCQIIVLQSAYGKCALSTIHFSGMWISFPKGVIQNATEKTSSVSSGKPLQIKLSYWSWSISEQTREGYCKILNVSPKLFILFW